jgi:hypothetical protein
VDQLVDGNSAEIELSAPSGRYLASNDQEPVIVQGNSHPSANSASTDEQDLAIHHLLDNMDAQQWLSPSNMSWTQWDSNLRS